MRLTVAWPSVWIPILALLRRLEYLVDHSNNKLKLWQIFIIASWSNAADSSRLQLKTNGTVWEEIHLYAYVIRNARAIANEQEQKLKLPDLTRAERCNSAKIGYLGNRLLVRFNSRIQSMGDEFGHEMHTDAIPECEDALLKLAAEAKKCPKLKVPMKGPEPRDPIDKNLGLLDQGLAGLRKHGMAPYTGYTEKTAAIMKVKIRQAQNIPTLNKRDPKRRKAA